MEYEFTDSETKNYSDIITPDYYSSSINPVLTTDEDININDDLRHLTSSTTDSPWTTVTTMISGGGSGSSGERNVTSAIGEMMDCTFLDYNYEPITTVISASLFIFGLLFCIFGYRCFKAVLFLTGFTFGLVIVFLICQVEDLLPQYGNVGISTLSGFLYGLICLLVPYVGFFTLGFHAGLLAGLASMIFFPVGYSIWISVIFLLGTGLFGAVANVCFPSLTILTTSMIGGAGIAISFDYFVEKLKMAFWVWSHIKGKEEMQFCWFSWLLLGLWPILMLVGVIIQSLLTARGFDIHIYPYKKRHPPRRRLTREERALARQAKYRYLYQVRTAGGDILSQAYIQSLQNKSQLDTLSTHMSTLQTTQEETSTSAN